MRLLLPRAAVGNAAFVVLVAVRPVPVAVEEVLLAAAAAAAPALDLEGVRFVDDNGRAVGLLTGLE